MRKGLTAFLFHFQGRYWQGNDLSKCIGLSAVPLDHSSLLSDTSGRRQGLLADNYEGNQYDVSQMKKAALLCIRAATVRPTLCLAARCDKRIKRRLLGFASEASYTLQHCNSFKLFSGNAEAENNCTIECNGEFKWGQKMIYAGGKKSWIFFNFLVPVEPDTSNGLIYWKIKNQNRTIVYMGVFFNT